MDGIFGWTLGRRYPGRRYRRCKRADLARRSRPSPKRSHAHHRAVSPPRSGPHFRIGVPVAVQIGLEIAVFAGAAGLIATIDATQLAAHEIAMLCAATTFMVPLGVSAAAAVRVGQAVGRSEEHTSELQSRLHLVCRLLLEKKKTMKST